MKKILIVLFLLVLSGCGINKNIGASNEDIEKEIIRIEKEQEKEVFGKYNYKEKYEKLGIIYEVNEYQAPCGIGYEIVMRKIEDGKEYVKIVNNGCESYRDKDWELFIKDNK